MAKPEQLSNLTYTRTWLSADDFPTIEPDETKVREDLQFHPDAVKDYINDKLLPSYNNILNEGLHCPGTLSFSGAVTAKYNGEVDATNYYYNDVHRYVYNESAPLAVFTLE